jgi:hypothetical protein
MRKFLLILAVAALTLASLAASAGDFKTRQGSWVIGGGLGFTEDPQLFGLEALVNYYITDEISVGPLFQFELSGRDQVLGLTGMVKYSALLKDSGVVRPYGQLGIGFAEFRVDDLFDGKRKTTYLFPVGGGMEFKLLEKLWLDGNILFNLSPEIFIGLFLGVGYIF